MQLDALTKDENFVLEIQCVDRFLKRCEHASQSN